MRRQGSCSQDVDSFQEPGDVTLCHLSCADPKTSPAMVGGGWLENKDGGGWTVDEQQQGILEGCKETGGVEGTYGADHWEVQAGPGL